MLKVFAPAKINLSLHVGPPWADGRHPIESIVAFADVGDELALEEADDLTLVVDGPFAGALAGEGDNLVLRAARLLRDAAGVRAGAALTLKKTLPVASGIGGGSADAAAALRGLNALWRAGLDEAALMKLGAKLGADVPACVASRSGFMTGGGEEVAPLDLPELAAVLVNPGVPTPTGPVYRAFDDLGGGGAFARAEPPRWADAGAARSALKGMRNDLTEAAVSVCPPIADALSALGAAGEAELVRLSGSGATVFALTADRARAGRLAARLTIPGWWVAAARLARVDLNVSPR